MLTRTQSMMYVYLETILRASLGWLDFSVLDGGDGGVIFTNRFTERTNEEEEEEDPITHLHLCCHLTRRLHIVIHHFHASRVERWVVWRNLINSSVLPEVLFKFIPAERPQSIQQTASNWSLADPSDAGIGTDENRSSTSFSSSSPPPSSSFPTNTPQSLPPLIVDVVEGTFWDFTNFLDPILTDLTCL